MTEHDNTAVVFNRDAYRAWMQTPTALPDGTTASKYDTVPVLATAYQRLDGAGGWLVEAVLDALRHDPAAAGVVWAYADGVSDVRAWAIADAEGFPDGGIVAEVTVEGVVLSLGRISENELVTDSYDVMPGYVAAEVALSNLAERVNSVADAFRQILSEHFDGLAGNLTRQQLQLALEVLAKMWQFSRNGGVPKRVTTTGEQHAAADAVLAAAERATALEGEVVYDPVYEHAAAAAGHDVNNPAHPTHW